MHTRTAGGAQTEKTDQKTPTLYTPMTLGQPHDFWGDLSRDFEHLGLVTLCSHGVVPAILGLSGACGWVPYLLVGIQIQSFPTHGSVYVLRG